MKHYLGKYIYYSNKWNQMFTLSTKPPTKKLKELNLIMFDNRGTKVYTISNIFYIGEL